MTLQTQISDYARNQPVANFATFAATHRVPGITFQWTITPSTYFTFNGSTPNQLDFSGDNAVSPANPWGLTVTATVSSGRSSTFNGFINATKIQQVPVQAFAATGNHPDTQGHINSLTGYKIGQLSVTDLNQNSDPPDTFVYSQTLPSYNADTSALRVPADGDYGVFGGSCVCPSGSIYYYSTGKENYCSGPNNCTNGKVLDCKAFSGTWTYRSVACGAASSVAEADNQILKLIWATNVHLTNKEICWGAGLSNLA